MSFKAKKFFWDVLDRVMFIGIGVIGAVATTYITGIMKLNPPELVARPVYSRIDTSRPVPAAVGALKLDYEKDAPLNYAVLSVGIANEGRGPADGVKFQVKLPFASGLAYDIEPDFKVYSPSSIALAKDEFYAELGHFPSGASDMVALKVEDAPDALKNARIKLANDEFEGRVEEMEGVEQR